MTAQLILTPDHRPDGTALLRVAGEIDMSNTADLAAALDSATGPLVLDLTSVDYLDSAGLSVLFAHADRLELLAPPLLLPVLQVSGLADLATVHRTEPAPGPTNAGETLTAANQRRPGRHGPRARRSAGMPRPGWPGGSPRCRCWP
ncbi:STAS domain-containing protein [Streptacidiphilus sp. PAMC 29251]